jgi:hypothetical protein
MKIELKQFAMYVCEVKDWEGGSTGLISKYSLLSPK